MRNIDELILYAEDGNVQAQFDFGLRSADADGVEQDCDKAIIWLRLVAKQGYK